MRHRGNWLVFGFITISIIFLTFIQLATAAAWTPPIGIPMPPFGINETAPPSPNPWNKPIPGFYYVDETHPSATDINNTYGTPLLPRKTIPNNLSAGSVVDLHGVYTKYHGSPATITANGTSSSPVFIRGTNSTNMPIIRKSWQIRGNYYILENLSFADNNDGTNTGRMWILSPTNYAALRFCDLSGNLRAGGVGVVSWDFNTTSNVVIYKNYIHDNGDVKANYDQDVHGIAVSARVSNLWIVDNKICRNSGDGIQINAGSLNNQPTTHHIYVGRNTSYSNKQSGMWTKQAVDVIFSENTIYNHRPSNSSLGQGTGFQHAPDYVWFLFNHIYDCEFGINAGSNSGMGFGKEIFVIGNLIHNIHPTVKWNPNNPWSSSAIGLWGGVNRRIVNNTIWDYSGGIHTPGSGYIHIENNILGGRTDFQGRDIFVQVSATASASNMNNNVIYSLPVRIQWGGRIYDLSGFKFATGKGRYCSNSNPQFVNQTMGDYHLKLGSPCIEAGIMKDVYSVFFNRYGINISKDIANVPRPQPQGGKWDIGAYEFTTVSELPENLQKR
jgi:hypothetical protein